MKRLVILRYPSAKKCYDIIKKSKYKSHTSLSKEYRLSKHYIEKICTEFNCMDLPKIRIKLACMIDEHKYLTNKKKFYPI